MGKDKMKLWKTTSMNMLSIISSAALFALTLPAAQAQIAVHDAPDHKSVQAVVVDELPLVHTTQFIALDKQGTLQGQGSLEKQINHVFAQLNATLKAAGSSLDQTVKLNICLKDAAFREQVALQIDALFKRKKPAVSFVTGDLRHPDAVVGIDAVALSTNKAKTLKLIRSDKSTSSNSAAAAILPAGGAVYVSGQAAKGDLEEATTATLQQLEQTLQYLDLKKEDIIQVKSFVHPAAGIRTAEEAIARFFGNSMVPPLVFVEWLSKDPIIEIELIAASPKDESRPQLEFLTPAGMSASPVYAKVVRLNYGKKIYTSGLDMKTEDNQVLTSMKNTFESLKETIKKAGSDMEHLVKATYYVADKSSSDALNTIRPQYYHPNRPPAASKAMIKAAGKPGALMTMDMIGIVPAGKKIDNP